MLTRALCGHSTRRIAHCLLRRSAAKQQQQHKPPPQGNKMMAPPAFTTALVPPPLPPLRTPAAAAADKQAAAAAPPPTTDASEWRLLGTPRAQLTLDFTLPTGQSFRWRRTGAGEYTGVVGARVVQVRQLDDDVAWRTLARAPSAPAAGDAAALSDYFSLGVDLEALYKEWAAADAHFAKVAPLIPGARLLRQDPVECLFQFVCSQNNHISRIQGMVERLCSAYGTPLLTVGQSTKLEPTNDGSGGEGDASSAPSTPRAAAAPLAASSSPPPPRGRKRARASSGDGAAAAGGAAATTTSSSGKSEDGCYYAFPTLEQLASATEDELRALGFGYRAKFIVGAVAELRARPGGGEAWLHSLRQTAAASAGGGGNGDSNTAPGAAAAAAALEALPGVGPKVAACVALFSLDQHDAIPVDTHVWSLATRFYAPHLRGKALTKKLHAEVAAAFVARFGARAGWAHSVLFVSDLRQTKALLEGAGVDANNGGGGDSGSDSDY